MPTTQQLEALLQFDSCTLSNSIESFGVRLPDRGFADSTIRPVFAGQPPILGYAVTGRIRTSSLPPGGHRYGDRTDWWNYVLTLPAPRVVVLQDVDDKPGFASFIGEVHAAILRALGCAGVVTDGAVRDLGRIEAQGFPLFARNVAISHAFSHLVDFGGAVEVGGLPVAPGDLLFGDRHGVLAVPADLVPELPGAAVRLLLKERRVIDYCSSPEFSLDGLRGLVEGVK